MQYDTIIALAEANSAMSRLCEELIAELAQYKEVSDEERIYQSIAHREQTV